MSVRHLFPVDSWKFQSEAVLQEISTDDRAALMRHETVRNYPKGEIIFREGGAPQGIFYLKTGKVKKYKLDDEGREHIIYVANVGEWIGYHALLSDGRYPDSAATLEASQVAFIPKEDFLEVLNRSSDLSRKLLKALSHEFSVFVNTISLMSGKSVRQRLALQLILLREKYKSETANGEPVEINLSRDDLASLIGTVRENVVRVLSEFKAKGIIHTRGRSISIVNIEELLRISEYVSQTR